MTGGRATAPIAPLNLPLVLADIEKAFLQVGIQDAERDVTRFLWLRDPAKLDTEDNLITYESPLD